MRIGLLDSGLGGLTVLKKLINKCPNNEFIYFGDTYHLPYGEKTKEEVVSYGNKIIKFLEDEKVDIIIIACGTLSSHRECLQHSKPLIDIISPLEGKLDNYHNVAIMATPLSIQTNAFAKYIKTKTTLISTPKLVPLIENQQFTKLKEVLKKYLNKAQDSDALLLGCTHYPLIKDLIEQYYHQQIITLDEFIIDKLPKLKESVPKLKLYFSLVNDNLIANVTKILARTNLDIERKCL